MKQKDEETVFLLDCPPLVRRQSSNSTVNIGHVVLATKKGAISTVGLHAWSAKSASSLRVRHHPLVSVLPSKLDNGESGTTVSLATVLCCVGAV